MQRGTWKRAENHEGNLSSSENSRLGEGSSGGGAAKGSGAKVVANFGENGKCFGFKCSGFGLRMRCAGAKNKDKEFQKQKKSKHLLFNFETGRSPNCLQSSILPSPPSPIPSPPTPSPISLSPP